MTGVDPRLARVAEEHPALLEEAGAATGLPDASAERPALHDLLLRLRGCGGA